MADLVREWFQRKRSSGVSPFRAFVTVSHECNHVTGPRSIYAKVTLSISPCEVFEFDSTAKWPEENYDHFVLDGILDALFGCDHTPMLAARFVLQEVAWHPVNSAPIAYYRAAKIIVKSLLIGQNA